MKISRSTRKTRTKRILNGIHRSFNEFTSTVLVSFGYLVFVLLTPVFASKSLLNPSVWNLSIMIYIFCGLIALTVLLLTIFAKEDKNEKLENKSFNLKDVLRVLKNYKI
ncbi:hypothetical protein [Mycoplasma putrefaciens]|uniref:hypothetical protein n=1 Tax=Mycoplasma putrefaciens TaxID=2123 RepID=UPI001F3114E1|nr:hypothetical protein [Mycoplasma putrefaciens]